MKRLAAILCLLALVGCSRRATPSRPESYLGTVINLPKEVTVPEGGLGIVAYFDMEGCEDCKFKEFPLWQDILMEIEEIRNRSASKISVVFFVKSGNKEKVESAISSLSRFTELELYYDEEVSFSSMNRLPDNGLYHSFLLDAAGRVLLIGNPVYNPSLWARYKENLSAIIPSE